MNNREELKVRFEELYYKQDFISGSGTKDVEMLWSWIKEKIKEARIDELERFGLLAVDNKGDVVSEVIERLKQLQDE